MAATMSKDDIEKLPIVELRPFIKQEWRPSKSLPDLNDRQNTSLSFSYSPRKAASFVAYPEPLARSDFVVRVPAVSPKAFSEGSEKLMSHKQKPREGKHVENRTQAFAPLEDREKTTVEDITNGNSVPMQFSLKRGVTQMELINRHGMGVRGKKLDCLPTKNTWFYAEPWVYYKFNKVYAVHGVASAPGNAVNDWYMRLENLQEMYGEQVLNEMERSETLPSMKVSRASLRKRKTTVNSPELKRGTSRPNLMSTPVYRLGVKSGLEMMREYGKPISVEQNLAMQIRNTLNHLRRTKDNVSLFSGSPKLLSRYDGTPTPGETSIKLGLDSNSCRRSTKDSKTSNGSVSRSTTVNRMDFHDSGTESTTQGYRSRVSPTKSVKDNGKDSGGDTHTNASSTAKTVKENAFKSARLTPRERVKVSPRSSEPDQPPIPNSDIHEPGSPGTSKSISFPALTQETPGESPRLPTASEKQPSETSSTAGYLPPVKPGSVGRSPKPSPDGSGTYNAGQVTEVPTAVCEADNIHHVESKVTEHYEDDRSIISNADKTYES